MTIQWEAGQRSQVSQVLADHPAESGRCQEAANAILPVARQVDAEAVARKLVPAAGRFVVPKHPLQGKRWWYHVTVAADDHMVDALTGADGTAASSYLAIHWHHPEFLRWVDESAGGGHS